MSLIFRKLPYVILCLLITASAMELNASMLNTNASGQTNNGILIKIVNSSFSPLSTVEGNQIRIPVSYQINDVNLRDQKINGIMKIYSENGTLIRSSSFPDGFKAKEGGGTEVFRSTISDPTVTSAFVNITFIDFARDNSLSNSVTANLTLEGNNTEQTSSDEPQTGDPLD